ncbi:MAG: hypothetical protein UY39_C0018G0004 [Candidatus Kaiserbacteria bacterium GW2011_GWC2_49_12]|uniref:O-antigen ligase-related domain-containing protein n=1 Tax=Candidatus Kaiserbacteria bacterium GW2011_GWC2_49_12 TaxID=1618675 RepID=A0A0G1VL84_9BACT|nr:MAG: hypothetical protein UY39_C0018G0004 [Candidatus Kaiserbacteria bacterium GW2011_GWC2_49_12]
MTLEKVLRWIALGGIFALPFIVFLISTSLFFPFITGKNFAFRLIIEVITGAWLALALVNSAYRPQRQWLLGAFAIFVILIALADAFGVYPFKSFWSNYERMDGWITLAHLFLYFVVSSSMLSTEKLWRAFLQVSLAVSAVVGAHALLQLLGVASLNPGFSSATRLDATFGNPIYLASYMLFHVFIAALLLAHSGKEQWNRTERYVVGGIFTGAAILALSVFGKSGLAFYAFFTVLGSIGGSLLFMRKTYLLAFILTLDAVVLFLTGTRGAILGLSGGVMLAAFLFALSARDYQMRARQAVAGAVVIVLVLVGGLYLARDQSWVKDAPVLGRIATISIMESTAQARIMNWGVAWQGVKERPVLGWGQENFAIVFNKYYNPQMYGQEQWFDRVHNVVFDWLVAGGVLGLLAYLSLFVFALWYIWRRDAGERSFTVSEGSILTGLLAAYFFHNLFVFDNVMSYFLFASVLAFVSRFSHFVPCLLFQRSLQFPCLGWCGLRTLIRWHRTKRFCRRWLRTRRVFLRTSITSRKRFRITLWGTRKLVNSSRRPLCKLRAVKKFPLKRNRNFWKPRRESLLFNPKRLHSTRDLCYFSAFS